MKRKEVENDMFNRYIQEHINHIQNALFPNMSNTVLRNNLMRVLRPDEYHMRSRGSQEEEDDESFHDSLPEGSAPSTCSHANMESAKKILEAITQADAPIAKPFALSKWKPSSQDDHCASLPRYHVDVESMHDDYVYLPFKSDKMKSHFTEKIKKSFIKYYCQSSSVMPDLSNTSKISLVTKSNCNNSICKEFKSSKSIAPVVSNQKDGVDSLSVDAKSANSSKSRSSDIGSSTANSTTSSCRSGVKKGKNVKKNNKSVSDGNSIKKYFGRNSEPDANVSTSSSSSKRYPVCKKRTSLKKVKLLI